MPNTYLITDGYFKENYPFYNQLDMSKFYSTLLVEQQTTIEDWIGTILYNWIVENAATALEGDRLDLLNQIQYALIFLTALQLILLNNTPSSSQKERIESLRAKIAYLRAKLLGLVEGSVPVNPDGSDNVNNLQIIITIGLSTGGGGGGSPDELPDTEIYDSVIYYWR
jgi:hypothetical protein